MAQSQGLNNAWKLRGVVNVTEPRFGAKGDGITDDRAAVNTAKTTAAGRRMIFPSGTYNMGSALAFVDTDRLVFEQGASFSGTQPTGGLREYDLARATAVAGSKMKIEKLFELSSFPLEDEAGIWAAKSQTFFGVSREFTSSDGDSGDPLNSPCVAFFAFANNNNCPSDVVAIIGNAVARTTNDSVFAANLIARTASGISTPKLVGLEIDIQPSAGVTPSSDSIGLAFNAFSSAIPGPAILINGLSGGTFNNGLQIGGMASTAAGVGPLSGSAMDSLVNTGTCTYTTAAIIVSNNHRVRFAGTASAHGVIYNDTSNVLKIVSGANASFGFVVRNQGDTTSLLSISPAGEGFFNDACNAVSFKVSGNQVVGARGAAVADASGGATIDAEARTAINTLLARLRPAGHGLIEV